MQGVTLLAGLALLGSLAVPAGLLASEQASAPPGDPAATETVPGEAGPQPPTADEGSGGTAYSQGREKRSGSGSDAEASATRVVLMEDIKFKPRKIRIDAGDTVQWENRDKVRHDAIGENASFDTPLIGEGETSSHTFNRDGRFAYFCSIHEGMVGTVQVGSSSGGGGGGGGGDSGGPGSGTGGGVSSGGSTGTSTGTGTGGSGFGSTGSSGTRSSLASTGSELLWLGLIGYGLLAVGAFVRLSAVGR